MTARSAAVNKTMSMYDVDSDSAQAKSDMYTASGRAGVNARDTCRYLITFCVSAKQSEPSSECVATNRYVEGIRRPSYKDS